MLGSWHGRIFQAKTSERANARLVHTHYTTSIKLTVVDHHPLERRRLHRLHRAQVVLFRQGLRLGVRPQLPREVPPLEVLKPLNRKLPVVS